LRRSSPRVTPLEQRRVCIAPSSIESPRRPLRAPPRRSRERSSARPIYRGAERPRGRSDDSRWMRPIDFCRPTHFQAPYGLFDSPSREEDSVDAASLASVIAFLFTAISPALSSRTGVERSAVRVRFPGARPESVETGGSLWILPRLPLKRSRRSRRSLFGPMRVRRRYLWHPRHACVRRRTPAPRPARFRRSVKSVGRFRPQVPSLVSSAPPCSAAFATELGCARHPGVDPPLRGGAGASVSIRRRC
jgi:hypothetical protein